MAEAIVKVIGVGSPFGADQLAWWVVDGLRARPELAELIADGRVELVSCDRPGSALLELLQGSGCIHLIDAMISSAAPGTVRCLRDNFAAHSSPVMSSHGFGLGQALALAEALAELPPDFTLHAVEVEPDLAISPELEQAVQDLISRLSVMLVAKFSKE